MLGIAQQRILLALLKEGKPTHVRRVMELAGIQYNIRHHIEALRSLELVEVRENGYPRRKLVSLTEKGVRVARLLREIESLLQNSHGALPTPRTSQGEDP
ncbi:MAG: MarR family transcriptional regulator [Thermoprotei archaeon]|nr:MAG: MarR family transcriptional regulator [Thermoprotei archaeon]